MCVYGFPGQEGGASEGGDMRHRTAPEDHLLADLEIVRNAFTRQVTEDDLLHARRYSRDGEPHTFVSARTSLSVVVVSTRRWFDRKFDGGLTADAAPQIIERLRDAPDRLAEAVGNLAPAILTRRAEGKWSIQENAGHLVDLEELWDRRLDDYATGAEVLHPADLENRKTHQAQHNDCAIADIVARFTAARRAVVDKLVRMTPTELERTALHPRLRQPMSVVDLCYFVAEHDDHHLRTIEELRTEFAQRGG